MYTKKLAAFLLASAMAVPAAGCSLEEIIDNYNAQYNPPVDHVPRTTVSESEASVYVEDASAVFNHITYKQEMFYGKYIADGTVNTEMNDEAKAQFIANQNTFTMNGSHGKLTAMPYRVDIGPHCNVTPLNYLSGYDWALLYFYDAQGNSIQVQSAYTIDGNSMRMQLIKDFDYNSEAGTLDYQFSGDVLKYYYILTTDGLELSNSEGKVLLRSEDLAGEDPQVNVFDANLTEGSTKLDGIDTINLTAEEQYVMVDGTKCPVTGYELSEDGLFKLKWTTNGIPHAVQTAYLYGDDDGISLMDGEHFYLYNRRSNDLYTKKVNTNVSVSDSESLQNMSNDQISALEGRVDQLYNDLEAAFAEAGVDATINRETGEIALNSVVLFAVDDYFISGEGQYLLTNFLKAYTSVIFDDKYKDFVTSIEIQGHTDPTGLADHNQVLSQARANQVKDFCLSPDGGLDAIRIGKLEPMLTAVGYAATHPIFAADGEVDLDASRRVSFRFMVDIGANAQ